VLAHIDHGKTTLTDSFLSSTTLLSAASIGSHRYLDSLAEERDRGITIRSSAALIGLLPGRYPLLSLPWFHYPPLPGPALGPGAAPLYFQLFDSPGHLDFSAEVTTCLSLTGAAVLLIDVVEGVSLRTVQLLRHVIASSAGTGNFVVPLVVVNKLDKLAATLPPGAELVRGLHDATQAITTALSSLIASLLLPFQSSLSPSSFSRLEALWTITPTSLLYGSGKCNYLFSLDMMSRFYTRLVNKSAAAPAAKLTPRKLTAAADQGFCGYLNEASPPTISVKRTPCSPPPPADGLCYRGDGGPLSSWMLFSFFADIRGLAAGPDPAASLARHPLTPPGYAEALSPRELRGKSPPDHVLSTWFPATPAVFLEIRRRLLLDPPPPPTASAASFLSLRKSTVSSSFQVLPGSPPVPKNSIVSLGRVHSAPLPNGAPMHVLSPSGAPDPETVAVRTFLPQCDSFFEVKEVPPGCICAVLGVEGRGSSRGTNK
jgi:hypothetical protein